MRSGHDLLYTLFEQHLFNALVENETSDEFLARVVAEYIKLLSSRGMITREHRSIIEEDLKEEVLEMLRKKTYGHFNLAAFRRSLNAVAITIDADGTTTKGRRNRRAC
jgi:calcineurin-like phosphoesterase